MRRVEASGEVRPEEDSVLASDEQISITPPSGGAVSEGNGDGQRKSGAFRAFKHRNYRLYWGSQLISLTGTWMQNLAQGWLIILLVDPAGRELLRHGGAAVGQAHQQHAAAVEAAANLYSGWVNFAGGIPILFLTLLAGVVADRVNKRIILIATQSIMAFCAFGLGGLIVLGRVEVWHVLFFACLSGVAAAFDMPTRQSFMVDMVGREDLTSAVALGSSVFNSARAIGPAVAGLLLAANVGLGVLFLGNAAMTLVAVAALCLIRPAFTRLATTHGPKTIHELWVNMREGFRYVRSHQTVGNLVFLVGMFGTFAFSFNALIPVFVRYTLVPHAADNVQVKVFGLLETVRGFGALGGALTVVLLGNARRQRNMLIAGSIVATVVLFGFASARTLWLAYTTMAIASYAFVLCFATSNTLMQITVPDHLRGRVMSIYTLMFIGTMPIGSLFAGWLARYIGSPHTIMICAGISLAAAIVVAFRRGGLREINVGGSA